jgi:hypothetical protein
LFSLNFNTARHRRQVISPYLYSGVVNDRRFVIPLLLIYPTRRKRGHTAVEKGEEVSIV